MNFVKNILDGKTGEKEHLQFMKFSKGEFRDRAVIHAKQSAKKISVKTTSEFGNELVLDCAKKLGNEKVKVVGAIVTTANLDGELEFKEKKQFQGVKKYLIDAEMNGNEIVKLLDKLPKAFFGLSFQGKDFNLKIKAKAPKSGKPSTKGEEAPVPDFCKLDTEDIAFGRSFVFEKPDFKEADVKHTFFVEQIVVPDFLKNEKDFAVVREKSLRKGKIIREATIDGIVMKKEINFEV